MRFEMKMPDLATTDSEIRIVRWIIPIGQKVKRGQPLLEVETDKAAMEVESVVSGVLEEVRAPANEAVSAGQMIAVLAVAGPASTAASTGPARARQTAPPTAVASVTVKRPAWAAGGAIGMFARNRAARDTPTPVTPSVGIPLSFAQRVAAKRLQESKQTIPHFYLQTSFNASAVIARRKAAEPAKLAWDAFLCAGSRQGDGKVRSFSLPIRRRTLDTDRSRCHRRGRGPQPRVVRCAGGVARRQNGGTNLRGDSASRRTGAQRGPRGAADPAHALDRDQPGRLPDREFHPHHQSAGSRRVGHRPSHAHARSAGRRMDRRRIPLHADLERGPPYCQREIRGRLPRNDCQGTGVNLIWRTRHGPIRLEYRLFTRKDGAEPAAAGGPEPVSVRGPRAGSVRHMGAIFRAVIRPALHRFFQGRRDPVRLAVAVCQVPHREHSRRLLP